MRQTLVFDADDTLWENNVLFERVVADYLDWLAHPTLDHQAIRAVLDDVERANVGVHGYGTASFLRSLRDCFERLNERPADQAEAHRITELAAALVDHEVELMPGRGRHAGRARHPARPAAAHQGPAGRAATQDRRLRPGAALPRRAHRGREAGADLPGTDRPTTTWRRRTPG